MSKKLIKIYLAVPYNKMDKESAFNQVNEIYVKLIKKGYNVFSPITHSHPVVKYGVPGDWDFWKAIDTQFIEWCDLVCVLVPKEGFKKVEESTGIKEEIKIASELGKGTIYISAKDFESVDEEIDVLIENSLIFNEFK
jgi:nucleoside 2-deoxyribosyltransferase